MTPTDFRRPMAQIAPALLDLLAQGRAVDITVTGNSMRPMLLDRISRVRLRAPESVRRGDVVLYRRENGDYVLHRVVRVRRERTLDLCGDAQSVPERRIDAERVLARAVAFARRDKWRTVTSFGYALWWRLHLLGRPVRHLFSGIRRRLSHTDRT